MGIFLETDRLRLRRFTVDDVDNLVELDSDPAVMRYLTGKPTPRAVVQERMPRLIDAEKAVPGIWAAVERSTGSFLGWFELSRPKGAEPGVVELGYRLRRSAWGHGYATEGSRALVRKGFAELGVQRVVAFTMAVNAGSRRVMEKAGLRYVRTFHEQWDDPVDGTEHGEVEYALTRAEWLQLAKSTSPAS